MQPAPSETPGLRVTAYVLVADPCFLRESIASYLPWVDRVVLSYDEDGLSWSGERLPIDRCLEILADFPESAPLVHAPGRFSAPGTPALESETRQRQAALDQASEDADWVVQLDSDEVVTSPQAFFGSISRADASGAAGLDYPSRWLYSRVGPGRYLEKSRRWGGLSAGYPGPLAVRAGSRLRLARQMDGRLYRVDFAARSTDPWRPRDAPVHEVVAPEDGVLHFSWVRPDALMREKLAWSGHADGMDARDEYRRWVWRTKHPWSAAALSPFRSDEWFRLVNIPEPPGGQPT